MNETRKFRIAEHVGPVLVGRFVEFAKFAGFGDVQAGTGTVYATVEAKDAAHAPEVFRAGLDRVVGHRVAGLHPVVLREEQQ